MSMTKFSRVCVRHMSTSLREKRRKEVLDRIIRVDHAGEFGAHRIYEGQMAVLGKSSVGPLLKVCPPFSYLWCHVFL
jgi:demethoxyubiquinone hydroxylase (CLK1/Coq7/Cat5 family)